MGWSNNFCSVLPFPHFLLQESKSKYLGCKKCRGAQSGAAVPSGCWAKSVSVWLCPSSQSSTCTRRCTVHTCAPFHPFSRPCAPSRAGCGSLAVPGQAAAPAHHPCQQRWEPGQPSWATSQSCRAEQHPAPCDSFPHTTSQSAKHTCNLLQLVFL